MAHFRLITKTYMSNQLVVYLTMDAPFPQNHLFILMISFRLTTNTYFSIQLFVYMPTDKPVRQRTCAFSNFHSVYLYRSTSLLLYIYTQIYPSIRIHLFSLVFPSGKARRITCQLICWSTYPETYLKINQGVLY